jgi:hypothetical protein
MYEKLSIQNCVSAIADSCLAHFVEPSFIIYSLDSPSMNFAIDELEVVLPAYLMDDVLVSKGSDNTQHRINLHKKCFEELVGAYSLVPCIILIVSIRLILLQVLREAHRHIGNIRLQPFVCFGLSSAERNQYTDHS